MPSSLTNPRPTVDVDWTAPAPVLTCRRTLHGAVLARGGRTLFVVLHRGRFHLVDDVRRSLGASYDSRRKAMEAARSRLLREAGA